MQLIYKTISAIYIIKSQEKYLKNLQNIKN